jgi:hypothetical protein
MLNTQTSIDIWINYAAFWAIAQVDKLIGQYLAKVYYRHLYNDENDEIKNDFKIIKFHDYESRQN